MDANNGYSNFIANRTVSKAGFWSGLFAFMAVTAFGLVQTLQILDLLTFPLDEILIYGCSLCITIPFMLAILALHHLTKSEKKFWTHASVLFATVYVVFAVSNYVVQLATVIPLTVRGAATEISVLKQTPHSLFWDYDAIAYISMGFATLFAVPAFEKLGFQKWVRYTFLAHSFTTPLIAFVYFSPNFSNKLLLVATPWAVTAPLSMLMLCLLFKRTLQTRINAKAERL